MRASPALTVLLLATLACTGCSNRPRVYPISGTVTYAGKPIPVGVINFDPDVSKQNRGPQGYAIIKDGHYDTANGGKGVVGGPYLIRIQGFDGNSKGELGHGAPLFPEYQQAIDLPKARATQDIDVPAPKR